MVILKRFVFHPLLFAIFPTLALLAHNVEEVALEVAQRPLLYSLSGATLLLLVAYFVSRNVYRAGLTTTFLLILFFSYGHLYHGIKEIPVVGQIIGRHRFLLLAYLAFLALGLWWVWKKVQNEHNITQVLNVISVAILIYPVFQIVSQIRVVSEVEEIASVLVAQEEPLELPDGKNPPDIYYIILDTYTRADSMSSFFNFDNTYFLDSLIEMGFYVADCSRCNHCFTQGSLTSSLNLDYLPQLEEIMKAMRVDPDLLPLVKYSLVRGHLESIGYMTVAFDTGFFWTTITDADIFLGVDRGSIFSQLVNPFEMMLIRNSMGLVITDLQLQALRNTKQVVYEPLKQFPYSGYITRQLFILENLPKVVSIPGPKWVFAHISIPHPPRVFMPDGSIVEDPGYYSGEGGGPVSGEYEIKGYTNEVRFVNDRILNIIESILRRSASPPIIVLQADTGGPDRTITNILNAYYLRGEDNPSLYPAVSPVNTFRIIFDTYFGADYGLLPDRTYFADDPHRPVPETSPLCLN
ncbi:MAG: hypothetical protein GTO14_01285 [Anaerolineales bacterium]|nr:hypothetical protein [Anaerolineales bacterium]